MYTYNIYVESVHFFIVDKETNVCSWPFISTTMTMMMMYSSLLGLGHFFSFLILYTVGRTPWTGDQPIARPPLTHRKHKHRVNAHNTDIHALSGIRTHNPSVQASKVSSCLRLHGHCDRNFFPFTANIKHAWKFPFTSSVCLLCVMLRYRDNFTLTKLVLTSYSSLMVYNLSRYRVIN
jgi:hypothetical protein